MARTSILLTLSLWLALPAATATATATPMTPPRLLARAGVGVELAAPDGLLADPRVRPHLETGLTTTLAWRASARADRGGSALRGGARVEIRFEPWDEVYQAAALGVDGKVARAELDSFAALEAWWRDLRLPVLRAERAVVAALGTVRLELDVVPFSEAEARDAQRWLSDLLGRADEGAGEAVTGAAEPGADALDQVLNTLVATSIRRRAVASLRWRVAVEEGS